MVSIVDVNLCQEAKLDEISWHTYPTKTIEESRSLPIDEYHVDGLVVLRFFCEDGLKVAVWTPFNDFLTE